MAWYSHTAWVIFGTFALKDVHCARSPADCTESWCLKRFNVPRVTWSSLPAVACAMAAMLWMLPPGARFGCSPDVPVSCKVEAGANVPCQALHTPHTVCIQVIYIKLPWDWSRFIHIPPYSSFVFLPAAQGSPNLLPAVDRRSAWSHTPDTTDVFCRRTPVLSSHQGWLGPTFDAGGRTWQRPSCSDSAADQGHKNLESLVGVAVRQNRKAKKKRNPWKSRIWGAWEITWNNSDKWVKLTVWPWQNFSQTTSNFVSWLLWVGALAGVAAGVECVFAHAAKRIHRRPMFRGLLLRDIHHSSPPKPGCLVAQFYSHAIRCLNEYASILERLWMTFCMIYVYVYICLLF